MGCISESLNSPLSSERDLESYYERFAVENHVHVRDIILDCGPSTSSESLQVPLALAVQIIESFLGFPVQAIGIVTQMWRRTASPNEDKKGNGPRIHVRESFAH